MEGFHGSNLAIFSNPMKILKNKHYEILVSCSDKEKELHASSCKCMQVHVTPCKLRELHASSGNCM